MQNSYKPLKNIQILTIALNLPGPLATKRLVEMGATAIKVEPPSGDPFKQYVKDWYQDLNKNQEIISLDLKTEQGQYIFKKYLAKSALLITAQRPKALKRLGLDWPSLHKQYPRLQHLEIVGYPAPNDNTAGHDLTYQAALGLINPPHMPKTLLADMAAGEQAALKALEMIMAYKDDQAGSKYQLALAEAAEYMAQPIKYGLTSNDGLLAANLAEYAIYETKQGWLALAALEPHFQTNLKRGLGLEVINKKSLSKKFKEKTAQEWLILAKEYDIPLAKIN